MRTAAASLWQSSPPVIHSLGRSFEKNTAFLKRKGFLSEAICKGEEHAIEDFRPFPYLG